MKVFIVGITGGVGRRVANRLLAGKHTVSGMVRSQEQASTLSGLGINASIGNVAVDSIEVMAERMKGSDAIVFTAGAGGRDGADATSAVDGDGPGKIAKAAKIAGVPRLYLVSVFPEAWRERRMDEDFEHYMVEKKRAEIELVTTDIDWVILRPSALNDDPGAGTVDLGLVKVHRDISRDDVAETLVTLISVPTVKRVILEVTSGTTPIRKAVAALDK